MSWNRFSIFFFASLLVLLKFFTPQHNCFLAFLFILLADIVCDYAIRFFFLNVFFYQNDVKITTMVNSRQNNQRNCNCVSACGNGVLYCVFVHLVLTFFFWNNFMLLCINKCLIEKMIAFRDKKKIFVKNVTLC